MPNFVNIKILQRFIARPNKFPEYILHCRVSGIIHLRMPLYAEEKRMICIVKTFYVSVLAVRVAYKTFAQFFYVLMMKGIGNQFGFPRNLSKQTALYDLDFLFGLISRNGLHMVVNVLIKRTAHKNIQHLYAAAYSEYGFF